MEAILSNGGIYIPKGVKAQLHSILDDFNSILNEVYKSEKADQLLQGLDFVRHNAIREGRPFLFEFGVGSNDVGNNGVIIKLYRDENILIFVPCEIDCEI